MKNNSLTFEYPERGDIVVLKYWSRGLKYRRITALACSGVYVAVMHDPPRGGLLKEELIHISHWTDLRRWGMAGTAKRRRGKVVR